MVRIGFLAGLRIVALALAMQATGIAGAFAQGPAEVAAPPAPIEGVWQTLLKSEITIAPCPEGFCGTLSKIVVPSEGLTEEEMAAAQQMDPSTFTDQRNKDPELRNRPMLAADPDALSQHQAEYLRRGNLQPAGRQYLFRLCGNEEPGPGDAQWLRDVQCAVQGRGLGAGGAGNGAGAVGAAPEGAAAVSGRAD